MNPFGLNKADLNTIRSEFNRKQDLAAGRRRALFSVFDDLQTEEERVALEFLYAFMPLVDLADYDGDLFRQHVRHSLEVKKIAAWSSRVSGMMFLHYVLPYRISNEMLEDYRPYFFQELYGRVKHLAMADAVLEVNHWCHEKATYTASDPRTASPLALIRTARGRCGEESALLVAALRSLCLPARQVYTPRWAHTDSNHAWVEAWADGQWYFLGACEPEPRLNMGWFAGPARRAMLLHTRVYGTIYRGPEERVQAKGGAVELNLLPNYAPVRKLGVTALAKNGKPIGGAQFDFQVFNYGGFATIAQVSGDGQGKASFTTGFGDLLVHASAAEGWGYAFAKADGPSQIEVILDNSLPLETVDFEFAVPPELPGGEPQISQAEKEENDRRLKMENEIRAAYEATFISPEQAVELAKKLGIDQAQTQTVLEKARGNGGEIAAFLENLDQDQRSAGLELLTVLAAKDLTDTRADILLDHLTGSQHYRDGCEREDFLRYVLQPRISLEVLRPFRVFFQSRFSQAEQGQFRDDPPRLKTWIDQNIDTVENSAVRGWPSPRGTYQLGAGCLTAKRILFTALARSFGIAARLSPIDGKAQYLAAGCWIDAGFTTEPGPTPLGTIMLCPPEKGPNEPEYFHNFSLARLENGVFRTLRFRGLDEEAYDEVSFRYKLPARAGYYRLAAGKRRTDGSVVGYFTTFEVKRGATTFVPLRSLEIGKETPSLGSLPRGIVWIEFASRTAVTLDEVPCKQGLVLVWLEPDREPTKHLIRDLAEQAEHFTEIGVQFVFCLGEDKLTDAFDPENYGGLPARSTFVIDSSYRGLEKIKEQMEQEVDHAFPIVFVADRHRVVRHISTGYRIGAGIHILEYLEKS